MMPAMTQTSHFIEFDDARIPVLIRRHALSRRIVIRYQPLQNCVSMTLPRYVSIKQGLDFVESKRNWIARQRGEQKARVAFADGATIPILGQEYRLSHAGGRGVVTLDEGTIRVHGQPEFMERRFRNWLIERAREEITQRVRKHAGRLGVAPGRITLRDNSSCWGSCSHNGDLSFSWRLIFASEAVLDYVVCHEVAHIVEHNHSKRFWALVGELCPDWERYRYWLKAHGKTLYHYG